jgi:hypothetical protein
MMTSDCIPHQEREAERAAAHAKKEAERAASLEERETEMEARRATKKAEERSQIRKAEAEERLRKKLCADGFQLPARTDHSQLAPAVWDALLPQLPKRTGASAPPGSPVKLREAMPGVPSAAVGDLLFVCDFVRALGPALALPAECAAAGRLSQLILTHQHLNRSSAEGAEASATSAEASAEAATPPMAALVALHRQLLHVLLADSTAGEWWATGTAPTGTAPLRSLGTAPAGTAPVRSLVDPAEKAAEKAAAKLAAAEAKKAEAEAKKAADALAAEEAATAQAAPRYCPNGHRLQVSASRDKALKCDGTCCRFIVASGSRHFSCAPCDFDVCFRCAVQCCSATPPAS